MHCGDGRFVWAGNRGVQEYVAVWTPEQVNRALCYLNHVDNLILDLWMLQGLYNTNL